MLRPVGAGWVLTAGEEGRKREIGGGAAAGAAVREGDRGREELGKIGYRRRALAVLLRVRGGY